MAVQYRLTPHHKIDFIEAIPFRLPLIDSLRWGSHSILRELTHVLVRVILDNGATGIAEAPPRPTIYGETVKSIIAIIEDEYRPRLIGKTPSQAPTLLAEIRNNQTARGAIDMALHEASALSQGTDLVDLLDATKETIVASYILGLGPIAQMITEMGRVFEQGVRVFKVKIGRDWTLDIARLTEIRKEFGESVAFYVDANESFHNEDVAEKLARLGDFQTLYCEEPLPIEEVINRAALRQSSPIPLIADDSIFNVRDLVRELSIDTFDIVNIKPARTGYSESIAISTMAAAAGKGVMVGSQAGSGLGAARAGIFAARSESEYPAECTFFLKCREDILKKPIPIQNGRVALADLASVELDEERLQANRLII